jgi:hypothetical protein
MIKIDGVEDVKKLLHGEHSEQQKVTVGYVPDSEKKSESRQVGEKWFDSDGNEWEQKDGYVVKLGKEWQQDLHTYLKSFPNCRKETCTCSIPKRLDEKMRRIHGMCFDCVIDMEHKIRLQGKWNEYEKQKVRDNAMAWLAEAEKDKNLIAEELSKVDFANEFGESEKWDVPFTKEELLKKIEKEFEEFKENFIAKLEEDINNPNVDVIHTYIHDMNNHPMFIKNVDLNKNNVINLPILEKNVEKS